MQLAPQISHILQLEEQIKILVVERPTVFKLKTEMQRQEASRTLGLQRSASPQVKRGCKTTQLIDHSSFPMGQYHRAKVFPMHHSLCQFEPYSNILNRQQSIMHRFTASALKRFFTKPVVLLAAIPPFIALGYYEGLFDRMERNKIHHRISTVQYNANDPIEDRISYKDLTSGEGFAALVLDGHGGWQIAEFVNNELIDTFDSALARNKGKQQDEQTRVVQSIKEAFDQVENKILRRAREEYASGKPEIVKIGACALLVVVMNDKVYAANAGDSQGLLISQENGRYLFEKLNKKLNADSKKERKRLQESFPQQKDIVICKREESVCYVKGRLQPTRSFGDVRLKWKEFNTLPVSQTIKTYKEGPYITHVPEIRVFNLQKKHKYIVLGCDGLWDELSKGEVTAVIKKSGIRSKKIPQRLLDESLNRAAQKRGKSVEELKKVKPGDRRKLHDDISIIGISLQDQLN